MFSWELLRGQGGANRARSEKRCKHVYTRQYISGSPRKVRADSSPINNDAENERTVWRTLVVVWLMLQTYRTFPTLQRAQTSCLASVPIAALSYAASSYPVPYLCELCFLCQSLLFYRGKTSLIFFRHNFLVADALCTHSKVLVPYNSTPWYYLLPKLPQLLYTQVPAQ